MNTKRTVLFLCTGNSARSQMAEGWLRQLGGDRFDVASAGTKPVGLNPLAVQVMQEVGIDIAHHRSKHIDELSDRAFDLVITVCDQVKETCPLFATAQTMLHWSFEDPAAVEGALEARLACFRRVRDEIGQTITQWLHTQEPPNR
ncbi:MAG: arsenate reductase ArsC [Nitrospirae bacterium]|nr:MAG: arsenate reductase ArsC [Nitrospirota bacterium]